MDSDTDNLLFRLRELTEKAEAKAKAQGNWGLARDILRESVSLQVLFARPEVRSPLPGTLEQVPWYVPNEGARSISKPTSKCIDDGILSPLAEVLDLDA